MIRTSFAIAVAALAVSAPAFGQLKHWYLGASGGESRTSHALVENRESTIVNGAATSSDFDATDGAWKAFAGWRFNDYVGIEAAYADLGKSRLVTHTLSIDQLVGAIDIRRRITAYGADAVLALPIGPQFALFGRAGAFRTHLVADASLDGGIVFTNGPDTERSRTTTFNETVGHFGVGGEWRWRPDVALRFEWERFHDVGKAFQVGGTGTTGEADTDLASLGLLVRF